MSFLTGILVFGVTSAVGLPLAMEWGVLALVLNYIPFLGVHVRDVLPHTLRGHGIQSWQAPLLIFVSLNVIQIAVGSYIEPRLRLDVVDFATACHLSVSSGPIYGEFSAHLSACRSPLQSSPTANRAKIPNGFAICLRVALEHTLNHHPCHEGE